MVLPWLTLAAALDGLREWQSQLLKASPILAGVLLLLALVVTWFKRRRKAEEKLLSPSDQLAYFQDLHWRGELSKEEFERIQSLLGERMRQDEASAHPAAAPPPQEGPPRPPDPPETGIRPQPPG